METLTKAADYIYATTLHPLSSKRSALPSILMTTIPNSGSTSVSDALSKAADYRYFRGTLRFNIARRLKGRGKGRTIRPFDDPEQCRVFLGGGFVQRNHLPADSNDISGLITAGLDKMVLHTRDPRQVALSWCHYLERRRQKGIPVSQSVRMAVPDDTVFEAPLEKRIDWFIDHQIPTLVSWLEAWIEREAQTRHTQKPAILFTSFEHFMRDRTAFFEELFTFYDLDLPTQTPDVAQRNFRSGALDEWRSVYTPEQSARAEALVPEALRTRFGWT